MNNNKFLYEKQETQHVCGICGKEFTSNRKRSKFCSSSCRSKDTRNKNKKDKYCLVCGKKIGPGQSKYCSEECRNSRYLKTCKQCGEKFKKNYKFAKYCSHKCSHEASKKQSQLITCKYCGNEFEGNKNRKYCSEKCSCLDHRTNFKVCKKCGKNFHVKKNRKKGKGSNTYCSWNCYLEDIRVKKETKVPKKALIVICPTCGKEFKRINGNHKYCSIECRKFKTEKECKYCGEKFKPLNARNVFCSDECNKKYNNRVKPIKRKRKLKENGKVDYSISLVKLIKRDKGICHLCHKKVNQKAHFNSDDYPSIDHVIPVSKGGTHTWDNVLLAHRGCNSKRSNEMYFVENKGQVALCF